MKLHMRQFDGITVGMTAEGTPWAKREFKNSIFLKELKPKNRIRKMYPSILAKDVIPIMGKMSWLVAERHVQTLWFDKDDREIYIVYEEEQDELHKRK